MSTDILLCLRTVMPAARQCFADDINDCDGSQQQYLNDLANSTGFSCQPHSNDINAGVNFGET